MMSRQQINSRISDMTRAQIDALTEQRGLSIRGILEIAIDRMWREEIGTMTDMREVVEWDGCGWYAPRQEGSHESQHVHWYRVPGFDRDGYSADDDTMIWDATRPMGLGTPRWFDQEDDD